MIVNLYANTDTCSSRLGQIFWFPVFINHLYFLLVGGKLLYNAVLVSAIQQLKLAIIFEPPSPPPSHPSRSSQSTKLGSLCYTATSHQLSVSHMVVYIQGFPGSSAGKESACNAGDPSLTSGSRRSAGEGIGYPLQFFWASLVAQLVKNLPAMWETWVQSLGWEDPLEKGKATHSSILAWRIPQTVESMGSQRVRCVYMLMLLSPF